jgi:Ca2+-transporting ATPase
LYYAGDEVFPLTEADKKIFLQKAEAIQAQGSKVLAFAFKEADKISTNNFLSNLTLAGLIGFLDPPRMEVVDALQSCRDAGIKVIMITGDHPATALHIAQIIKLSEKENVVINGKELDAKLPEEKLFAATIFARVTPKQKLDMVSLYQKQGNIVAMTGDGINDAPALKKADIGIAMGIRGTQVAKETAAMILKDDSFTSIVAAIMQGRVIFKNIKNFLMYLLSCNLSEIFIVFFYGLLNFPFSILPLQILFLNLVTDIFPALALGLGKGNDLIMKIPPINPQQPIVIKRDWFTINAYAVLLAFPIMVVTWYCSYYLKYDAQLCNNITFFSLALSQLWHVLNLSSRKISFINNEITRNKFTWAATLLCMAIMAVFYFISPLNKIIGLQMLSINTWLIIAATSIAPVFLIQLFKRVFKIID